MSDQFLPQRKIPVRNQSIVRPWKPLRISKVILALLVFALAFGLRASHNIGLKHQVWLMGDAYNYMSTGRELYRTVRNQALLSKALEDGRAAGHTKPDHLKLASTSLKDRVSLDGLLYPSYLALAQAISGGDPDRGMEEMRLSVCLANSVLDALTCVIVFFAATVVFGTGVGLLSALILTCYPSYIVSTQQCLAEPLACFFMALWLLAISCAVKLSGSSIRRDSLIFCVLGLTTGLVMIAKPTHILLPIVALGAAGLFGLASRLSAPAVSKEMKKPAFFSQRFVVLSLVTLAMVVAVLTPVLFATKAITGEWSISAKRSPYENLVVGVNAAQDGWRAYPYAGTFPDNASQMLQVAKESISKDFGALLCITIKKISRLFSAVANDQRYSVLFLPYDAQTFFHRVLLVFAAVGTMVLLIKPVEFWASRRALCGVLFVSVVFFHCAYLLFEAMPRYALTAVPAIVIMAAYGMTSTFRSAISAPFFYWPLMLVLLLLLPFQSGVNVCAATAGMLGKDVAWMAPWVVSVCQSLDAAGIFLICIPIMLQTMLTLKVALVTPDAVPNNSRSAATAIIVFGLTVMVSVVCAVCSIDRRDWTEWKCQLLPGQKIKRTLTLPPLGVTSDHALILVDCFSSTIPPNLHATVNGIEVEEHPFPLAQRIDNNSSIIDGLMRCEFASGNDSRAFRQWWAIPVPVNTLKQQEPNELLLTAGSDVTLFGDWERLDGVEYLPSLWRFSHTKGYCSIEGGDPRIMERDTTEGNAQSGFFDGKTWASSDLSSEWGTQSGNYRIRLLVSTLPAARKQGSPSIEVQARAANQLTPMGRSFEINGSDPRTLFPIQQERKFVDACADGTRFEFSCDLRTLSASSDGVVNLSFGDSPGWSSQWQPIAVPISKDWTHVEFSDRLPQSVIGGNTEIHLMVAPSQPDLIYTDRKAALKSKIEMRNASIRFLPPIDLDHLNSSNTKLF